MESRRVRYSHAAIYGARIRAKRKAERLTLKGLSEKTGLSFQYLANIEKGEVNTGVETLATIADALKVPLRDIFCAPDDFFTPGYHALASAVGKDLHSKLHEALQLVEQWLALAH